MQESKVIEDVQTMPLASKGEGKGAPASNPCPPNAPPAELKESSTPANKGKGKGKGKGPPPPAAWKGVGKGEEISWKGKLVLKKQADAARLAEVANTTVPSGPKFLVTARFMDGREFQLCLSAQDIGRTAKQQLSDEFGISASRLKLIAGTDELSDFVNVSDVGLDEGSEITVIILSPLHGSLNRSGLHVPVDVMEKKMELHDSMLASALLRQTGKVV